MLNEVVICNEIQITANNNSKVTQLVSVEIYNQFYKITSLFESFVALFVHERCSIMAIIFKVTFTKFSVLLVFNILAFNSS